MISSSVTIGLIEALTDAGLAANKVLESLDLDPAVFSRADGFIPCSSFARLLERAAELTGDFAFGLCFGARSNPKNIGALAYAVLNSVTVAAAFGTAARYLHVHNEAAQVTLREANSVSYMTYSVQHLDVHESRQFTEYGIAIALNTLRVMVGSQWSPREVHFAHEPPPTSVEHLQLFRAPVLFSCATNALVMDREFCQQPIPAADPTLFKVLSGYLENVLSHLPKEDPRLELIRRSIAEAIKHGNPSLGHVANALACSTRTLQRQLNTCATDFRTLLDDTRKRLAEAYLKDSKNTLTQIAFLLGYSEVSTFNRSFKRWTGKTPLDYRRSLRAMILTEPSGPSLRQK
ncbi:MAG TPA: AraC family transcriptional regulator [Candidatus Binatia bacterium]|nr:AraC family transcriptional regulator [Candidatus Binatia bacterium]